MCFFIIDTKTKKNERMERAISEVFDFNDVKLQVKDTGQKICCGGCYFSEPKRACDGVRYINQTGKCFPPLRADGKNVIFVEVQSYKDKENKL